MQETRRARLQSVIMEEISTVLAREVKDPRIPPVTLTAVEVTPDGGQATIFVAILGGAQGGRDGAPALSEEEGKQRMKDCLTGLNSAAGFLRRHLAKILTVRHIPSLIFREDRGFENSHRVHELLQEITVRDSGIQQQQQQSSSSSSSSRSTSASGSEAHSESDSEN